MLPMIKMTQYYDTRFLVTIKLSHFNHRNIVILVQFVPILWLPGIWCYNVAYDYNDSIL